MFRLRSRVRPNKFCQDCRQIHVSISRFTDVCGGWRLGSTSGDLARRHRPFTCSAAEVPLMKKSSLQSLPREHASSCSLLEMGNTRSVTPSTSATSRILCCSIRFEVCSVPAFTPSQIVPASQIAWRVRYYVISSSMFISRNALFRSRILRVDAAFLA